LWQDYNCDEANNHVVIGKENYFLSGDSLLMPTKKEQPPPDLRYFKCKPENSRDFCGRAGER
jgi:hypothetical protein